MFVSFCSCVFVRLCVRVWGAGAQLSVKKLSRQGIQTIKRVNVDSHRNGMNKNTALVLHSDGYVVVSARCTCNFDGLFMFFDCHNYGVVQLGTPFKGDSTHPKDENRQPIRNWSISI
jgi:hypothetical protein